MPHQSSGTSWPTKAIVEPSGDQDGATATPGPGVRFLGSPPAAETTKRSLTEYEEYSSSSERFAVNASHFPSGDQVAGLWSKSPEVTARISRVSRCSTCTWHRARGSQPAPSSL